MQLFFPNLHYLEPENFLSVCKQNVAPPAIPRVELQKLPDRPVKAKGQKWGGKKGIQKPGMQYYSSMFI